MAELAAALRDAGSICSRTILASGNVVLDARGSAASVRKKAESTLRETFGDHAWALVYDLGTVGVIVEGYPFEPEVEGHHSDVTFVSDPAMLDQPGGLAHRRRPATRRSPVAMASGTGRCRLWPRWISTIGKTMGKKRYKSSTTTRSLRTLGKVVFSRPRARVFLCFMRPTTTAQDRTPARCAACPRPHWSPSTAAPTKPACPA